MAKINEWVIPKNIDKPTETVYELKDEYKIPNFEEFMKSYKVDEKLNYNDLSGGSVDLMNIRVAIILVVFI